MSPSIPDFLQNVPGPSPWFWKSFPPVLGNSGQRFVWRYHGDTGELPFLVTFDLEREPDKPLLALNSYCTPFLVPPANLGIWCPEGRNIRLVAFDPDQLKAFSYFDIAGWFKTSSDRIYSATEPIADFEVSAVLPPGTHPIDIPGGLHTVDEVLAPISYPAKAVTDAAAAIYAFYPQAGLLEVMPQKWFTTKDYEPGRQWITRVTRDRDTHRIVGEGFRVPPFELDESGTQVARWL
jgi:hypothetical protein